MHPAEPAAAAEPLQIAPRPAVRPDLPGFWNVAWPLAMVAVLLLALMRACVPVASPAAPFDAAAATRTANQKAMAALDGLANASAPASADTVLAALNLMVINFATGSAVAPSDAAPLLDAAARALALLPDGTSIRVVGHTDGIGSMSGNLALSRARAEAIQSELAARGVALQRLVVDGAGDAKPIATNATEAGRFANRRIEFAAATTGSAPASAPAPTR